ncbi:substrate-binding domain-containing protein [Bacillus songklensis]|uniref:Substrate-binding domain-containing protein n=1 Tax=Bacillus songklensis TaxID=1069116 RepID=A0ABV8B1T7_9BACI
MIILGIVTGRFDSSNQRQRVEGFKDAINKEKRIKLVDIKESHITKNGAVQAAYNLLRENPYLTAFYGTSALDGIGVDQAVKQFPYKPKPYIVVFDTLPETLSLVQEGSIDATISQYPYEMGYEAVEVLLKLKKGEHPNVLQHTDTMVISPNQLPITPAVGKEL